MLQDQAVRKYRRIKTENTCCVGHDGPDKRRIRTLQHY